MSIEREKELLRLLRITLSFKQTTRDVKLYNLINSKEEKSDFIKDCIEFYIKSLELK